MTSCAKQYGNFSSLVHTGSCRISFINTVFICGPNASIVGMFGAVGLPEFNYCSGAGHVLFRIEGAVHV